MSEEDNDKPFDATEQKLRQARAQGDIPRSSELNAALMYLGLWGGVVFLGAFAAPRWLNMARRALGGEAWPELSGRAAMAFGRDLGGYAVFATLVVVALMGLCILLGLLAQRSIIFTPSKLAPDIKRINPFKNAAQKFGRTGLVGFAISLGKAVLVAVGGYLLFQALLGSITDAAFMAEKQWVVGLGEILDRCLYLALGVAVIFAAVDLLWKRLDFLRRQRMSRKEVMDEHKESEGDPHFKAARRQKGYDLVMRRMLDDVQKADVVIVNPTHYAVALEWKRNSGRAPVCLAKGTDDLARRIRERAAEHGVPIWSDPPSARALFATVEIGQEIEVDHFAAVAAAIRYAEKLRKQMRDGWAQQEKAEKARKR